VIENKRFALAFRLCAFVFATILAFFMLLSHEIFFIDSKLRSKNYCADGKSE